MDSVEPLTAEAELLKCIDFMQTCGGEIPTEVIVLNAIFFFYIFFCLWSQSSKMGRHNPLNFYFTFFLKYMFIITKKTLTLDLSGWFGKQMWN